MKKGSHQTDTAKLKMSNSRKGKCTGKDHPMFGKHHTPESIIKMVMAHEKYKGKKQPVEVIMRRTIKIKEKWQDPEYKKKISKILKKAWENPEFKKKQSEARKGHATSTETRQKISKSNTGKIRSEEVKQKLKGMRNGINTELKKGKEHRYWKGGTSFEPYSPCFDSQAKERVRVRDNFICQLCGIPELECNHNLSVHHIDYDKLNSNIDNLVCLCKKCHAKTSFNREYWKEFFSTKKGEEIQ